MQITFATGKLKKEFEDGRLLQRVHGHERAMKIQKRMAQMEAALHLAQLRNQPGRFHELTGNLKGSLACDLDQPYRLIFKPVHSPLPALKNGSLDWGGVTNIQIEGIVDYHG